MATHGGREHVFKVSADFVSVCANPATMFHASNEASLVAISLGAPTPRACPFSSMGERDSYKIHTEVRFLQGVRKTMIQGGTLRKTVAAAAAVLALLGACDRGTKPNPKPRKEAIITAPAVVMCVDAVTLVRHKDSECVPDGGLIWIYVVDKPVWTKELPAVREVLELGRGQWDRPNVEIATVPDAGGFFD